MQAKDITKTLLAKIDIVDVISKYVQLKKKPAKNTKHAALFTMRKHHHLP